jgi:hypothetical protein
MSFVSISLFQFCSEIVNNNTTNNNKTKFSYGDGKVMNGKVSYIFFSPQSHKLEKLL